jgi:2-oxoglutarate ferredoxin oxidoreductase subunit beta
VVELDGNGASEDDCLVWDEAVESPALAFLAAQLLPPELPTPIGVFRAVDAPRYDEEVLAQMERAVGEKGPGTLEDLLYSGETWQVS